MQENKKGAAKQIIIFDTSLRDGEQSPGASMTVDEKIAIAKQLEKLGVDIIEAGFPVSSEGDFEAVRQISNAIKKSTVCALARCCSEDIIAAGNALQQANSKRIHVFIATSEIHMKYKLDMTRAQVLERVKKGVKQAKQYTDDIEFSAEDATRTDLDFLIEIYSIAIDAGATTINIPDTVGYSAPNEYAELVKNVKARVKGIDDVVISVHCHNDLGLATANSLAAVQEGATQIECTVNGIGERSGNCALEEIVMGLKTRHDLFSHFTNINSRELLFTSQLVSRITGMAVQPNKAIVGQNAFAHEAGIHQHGVIKHRETYEIMNAEDVGFSGNQIVIGKHSGFHAIKRWLESRKIELNNEQIKSVSKKIKLLADTKKRLSDQDIFDCLPQQTDTSIMQSHIEKSEDNELKLVGYMSDRRW